MKLGQLGAFTVESFRRTLDSSRHQAEIWSLATGSLPKLIIVMSRDHMSGSTRDKEASQDAKIPDDILQKFQPLGKESQGILDRTLNSDPTWAPYLVPIEPVKLDPLKGPRVRLQVPNQNPLKAPVPRRACKTEPGWRQSIPKRQRPPA